MKPAKLSFFSNLALIVITVILIVCALPLPYLTSETDVPIFGKSKGEVFLTKYKITVGGSSDSTNLKDFCDISSGNSFCKLYKASDTLITLSTFGMACVIVAGVFIILDICCKMSKKSPMVFRLVYLGTVIAGFVLFLVSFIVYTVVAKDSKTDGVKYGTGWILYLVGMIFSFFVLLLGLSNLIFKD